MKKGERGGKIFSNVLDSQGFGSGGTAGLISLWRDQEPTSCWKGPVPADIKKNPMLNRAETPL